MATASVGLLYCLVVGLGHPDRPGNAFPSCPFKAVTGWDCPGCGSTRAMHELLHGDVVGAAHYNVLAVLALPLVLYSFLAWAGRSFGGRALPRWQPRPTVIVALIAVFVVWGVVRNVPVGPLRHLYV